MAPRAGTRRKLRLIFEGGMALFPSSSASSLKIMGCYIIFSALGLYQSCQLNLNAALQICAWIFDRSLNLWFWPSSYLRSGFGRFITYRGSAPRPARPWKLPGALRGHWAGQTNPASVLRPKSDSDPDCYGKTPATWVISAAAPHHATGNRALLSGFIFKHEDLFVHGIDEKPMQVVARGTVITDDVTLPDVWFVPGLTVNLLSVSQLVGLDYSVEFGGGMCYIRGSASDGTIVGKAHLKNGTCHIRGSASDGTIVGKAHLKDRLYVLDFLKVPLAM